MPASHRDRTRKRQRAVEAAREASTGTARSDKPVIPEMLLAPCPLGCTMLGCAARQRLRDSRPPPWCDRMDVRHHEARFCFDAFITRTENPLRWKTTLGVAINEENAAASFQFRRSAAVEFEVAGNAGIPAGITSKNSQIIDCLPREVRRRSVSRPTRGRVPHAAFVRLGSDHTSAEIRAAREGDGSS